MSLKENVKSYARRLMRKERDRLWEKALFSILMFVKASYYNIFYVLPNYRRLNDLKQLRGTKQGKRVLLCANGTSINDLDWDKVQQVRKEGGFDIFVLNNFFENHQVKLKPDFCCLVDPVYLGVYESSVANSRSEEYERTISAINDLGVTVFCPLRFFGKNSFNHPIYFNGITNVNKGNIVDPTKPLGYISLTSLYSLSICHYLGYETIYIAGYDIDYFKNYFVDKGEKYIQENHFYDKSVSINHLSKENFPTTASVFYGFYQQYKFVEAFSGQGRVIVAAGGHYFDVFPRTNEFLRV